MKYLDLVPSRKLFFKDRRLKLFTLLPYPEDSLVFLSTRGYEQIDNHINVEVGGKVYYTAVKNRYEDVTGSKVVLENEIYFVQLTPAITSYGWTLVEPYVENAPNRIGTQTPYPVVGSDYAFDGEEEALKILTFDVGRGLLEVSPYGIYKRDELLDYDSSFNSMFLDTDQDNCKITLEESSIDHKITIDWGDGTTEEVPVGTTKLEHIYEDGEPEHTIKISSEDGIIPNITGMSGITDIISSILEMEDPTKGINLDGSNLDSVCSAVMDNNVEIRDLSGLYEGNTNLDEVTWDGLTTVLGMSFEDTFKGCTELNDVYFPDLDENSFGIEDDQFDNMLNGLSGCTVHFPSNLYDVMKDRSDVKDGFGGTNTKVVFDLYRGGSLDPDINRANARAKMHMTSREQKVIKGEVQDN